MPCEICGSRTRTPDSRRHRNSKKHKLALGIIEKERLIFKIAVIGDRGVGKTTFIDSIFGSPRFRSTCGWGVMPIDFHNYEIDLNDEGLSKFRVAFQFWDIQQYRSDSRFLTRLFLGAKFSIIIFDIFRYTTFEEALNWIMIMIAFRRQKIPFLLVGNKSDLGGESNGDFAEPEFGLLQTSAFTYLFNQFIGYLHTSSKSSIKEAITQNHAKLEKIGEFLVFLEGKIETEVTRNFEIAIERNNLYLASWFLTQMDDLQLLINIVKLKSIDISIRILAIKQILKINNDFNLEFLQYCDEPFKSIGLLEFDDQESLYKSALAGKYLIVRLIALDFLGSQEKLLEFAVGHKNPLLRMLALSKMTNEEYFGFIRDLYDENEINKEIILENITHDKFLFDLMNEDLNNIELSERAINRINTPKYLHILRLIGPQNLQPYILGRLREISND